MSFFGVKAEAVSGEPIFAAWLAGPPNISIFTNDSGYLTAETDPLSIHKDGSTSDVSADIPFSGYKLTEVSEVSADTTDDLTLTPGTNKEVLVKGNLGSSKITVAGNIVTIANMLEIFDESGVSQGYVPIYEPPAFDTKSGNFDGVNQKVTYPLGAMAESGADPFSCVLWFKEVASTSGYQLFYGNSDGGIGGFFAYVHNDVLTVGIADAPSNSSYIMARYNASGIPLGGGGWHQLIHTYKGTKSAGDSIMYLDGIPVGAPLDAGTFTVAATVNMVFSLAYSPGNDYFSGKLDEFSKWPVELSAANVAELYNAGVPKDITTMSFYASSGFAASVRSANIRFEDSWDDTSPNAYVGTPVNSPTFSTDVP